MRRIFITLLTLLFFAFAALTSFAQKDTTSFKHDSLSRLITEFEKRGMDHLKFKNIPIDGSLDLFVAQLKKQGFTVMKITDSHAILSGKFTGEVVKVLVEAAPEKVYEVLVNYDKQTTWKAIKTQYENMKSMLHEKYGDPQETTEKFDPPYYENSGLELYALSQDKCIYSTLFATKIGNGMIRLKITSDVSIAINYVDTINFLLVSGKAYNDL
jgi:hypothetical protein